MSLAVWGLLALAGCRNPPPTTETGPPAPGVTARAYRVAGVGFQTDQFFKLIEQGMKEGAQKTGVELSLGNSSGALDKEMALVETYITRQMDALVIAPFNPKASIPALRRARDSGLKIVTYDSSIEADFPVSNIKSDQTALGRATGEEAAKYIQEKLGGKAKVALISYVAFLPEPARERNNGFLNAIKKLPGVEIVAQQDAWMTEKAVSVVDALLTARPDINLIWAANEGGTVGAVTAVRNAGKAGKVVVFGTDISEQIADFLLADDNILQAVTGQKPLEIGALAVETAVKALKGEPVEKQVALPGTLFTRRQPDAVRKYRDYLAGLNP
jgi:ABC-type sugar transport system substrate-binding protein